MSGINHICEAYRAQGVPRVSESSSVSDGPLEIEGEGTPRCATFLSNPLHLGTAIILEGHTSLRLRRDDYFHILTRHPARLHPRVVY